MFWGPYWIPFEHIVKCADLLQATSMAVGLPQLAAPLGFKCWGIMAVPVAFSIQSIRTLIYEPIDVWLGTGLQAYSSVMHGVFDPHDNPAILLDLFIFNATAHTSTDPRDKIYGLLGMVQKVNSSHVLQQNVLKVDYRKSSVDVYCDFARAIMQRTKTPQYITKVWGREYVKSDVHNLPSWVPDFSIPQITTWAADLMANTKTTFSASKVSPTLTLPFAVDGYLLRLHCVTFSEIVQFGEYIDDNFYTGRFEESVLHLMLETLGPYSTGQDVVEVLWRTLICDYDLEQHPAQDGLSLSFRSWLMLEAMRAVGTSLKPVAQGVNICCRCPALIFWPGKTLCPSSQHTPKFGRNVTKRDFLRTISTMRCISAIH